MQLSWFSLQCYDMLMYSRFAHIFGCILANFYLSGHILHICVLGVLNRFVHSVIQLIKIVDFYDYLLRFCSFDMDLSKENSHGKVIWRTEATMTR